MVNTLSRYMCMIEQINIFFRGPSIKEPLYDSEVYHPLRTILDYLPYQISHKVRTTLTIPFKP